MRYLILIMVSVLFAISLVTAVMAKDNSLETINVVEIQVEQGETLWNIAKPYYNGKTDYRNFIDQIIELNEIKRGMIFVGQIIKIPVVN